MAEDEKKDQESTPETDNEKKAGGGKLKFVLIPVILLVQAVAAYFVVFNLLLKSPNQELQAEPKKPKLEVGQFFELNDIVINPAESGGRRYLVVELGLETQDAALVEEAKSKEILIRDAIISLLTSNTAEELMQVSVRNRLRKDILETLNEQMSQGKFDKLYFKKYILQ